MTKWIAKENPDNIFLWDIVEASDPSNVIAHDVHLVDREIIANAYDQATKIDRLEAEFSTFWHKLHEGTLHEPHCNADHDGPVGNDGCCCALGGVIKKLRHELDVSYARAIGASLSLREGFGSGGGAGLPGNPRTAGHVNT